MSSRGRGYCSSCNAEYFNRSKPKFCAMCGFEISGKFQPSKKKKLCPLAVKVTDTDYSVRTSNRDDRCFVTTNGKLWICSVEDCKVKRSAMQNSASLESFSCKHVDEAKNADTPMAILTPNLETFPCSENVRKDTQDILDSNLNRDAVIQVSESSFVVLGPATASNPLGYCHVKKSEKSSTSYVCMGKDCRGFSSKAKQAKTKSMCHHVLLLRSCIELRQVSVEGNNQPSSSGQSTSSAVDSEPPSDILTKSQVKRASSLKLAEQTKTLPYTFSRALLREISNRDARTMLAQGGWPEEFIPDYDKCQLCDSLLGNAMDHPGQHSGSSSQLLITDLNPFKRVSIKVKTCSSNDCLSMHQAQVEKLGLFNISDKVLISFKILLEFREFFKKGHPIGNVIGAKLAALRLICREEDNPTDNEVAYLEDLLYNGFFCFEMITERNMDDVVCGICGICPIICLGDGNEKNCCTNSQISYTKKGESQKDLMSQESFLTMLRRRCLERTVYTRNQESFSIAMEQLPPFMAPSLGNENILNTEMNKRSVYLQANMATGDPAQLHQLISSGDIEMEKLRSYDGKEIIKFCSHCEISTSGKSKEFLCGMLSTLYESILIGSCPCHSFGKLPGHTGGFYHFVCRHGTTVASKFLTLQESVRDPADLYLSLKHPPVVFINDTPCGFVRHMECRDPTFAKRMWGDNAGCFEKPEIDKQPSPDQNVPAIVPAEFSDGSVSSTGAHFVLGDRFHSAAGPHKSPLCQFHDINLCQQANTIKTSIQESQNNRKNQKRLRSSCMQSFEVHIMYNYLMDFYQNEEIVTKQHKILEKDLPVGKKIARDSLMRFTV